MAQGVSFIPAIVAIVASGIPHSDEIEPLRGYPFHSILSILSIPSPSGCPWVPLSNRKGMGGGSIFIKRGFFINKDRLPVGGGRDDGYGGYWLVQQPPPPG